MSWTRRSVRRRSSGSPSVPRCRDHRPIVEIMYLDFIGVCFDQLLNQAAKIRFMTGGRLDVPLVVRTQFGAGRSSGAQHSQSLEALLAHVPGLTVVMPSTPADAYGLLRAAIADPNPVIVIEHRLLYGMKGDKPPVEHVVPIGKAIIRRPGTDVTVVSWSRMVHVGLQVAEQLAADGISCEVDELQVGRTADVDLIAESVETDGSHRRRPRSSAQWRSRSRNRCANHQSLLLASRRAPCACGDRIPPGSVCNCRRGRLVDLAPATRKWGSARPSTPDAGQSTPEHISL